MKKRICVVTGSRADYGLLYWVMKEIEVNPDMKLIPVATGGHLSRRIGYTAREITEDGFEDLVKINILNEDTSSRGIAQSISRGVEKFADFFKNNTVDFLVLLGDRFEVLAVAIAALPYNIPIAHIGGGEISEGVIDDNIRHSLTKLSHLHFPIAEQCAKRILQLGEEPWRIHVVGSPRLDFMKKVTYKPKRILAKELGITFNDKVALVIYHPVTLEFKDAERQINNVLKAIEVVNVETIIFYPNIDTASSVIIKKIEQFVKRRRNTKLLKPLKRDDYFSLLNAIDIMVGNSSSGIVEAPSFKLPVVNIGNRQRGRDQLRNVISVDYSWRNIVKAMRKGLYDKEFIRSLKNVRNPYGDGKASRRIVKILHDIDLGAFPIMKKSCFNKR